MKQLTTPVLEVTLDIPHETVAFMTFLFTQNADGTGVALEKEYPGAVTYADGVYSVPFDENDTALFKADAYFYMDTRIVDQAGKVPETSIVSLWMSRTLFRQEV